jgi:hypothetical protein
MTVTSKQSADTYPANVGQAPSSQEPSAPALLTYTSPSVPPGGLGVLGVLTLLVGAWGGIVPFVAPSFGFNGDSTASWYWNLPHALLWLAPGALATVCGLFMMGLVPRALVGLARFGSAVAGSIVAICGAWFVLGPLIWPVLESSRRVFVSAPPLREFTYQLGYSLGPGLLLGMFGAFAMGWAVRSRRIFSARSL